MSTEMTALDSPSIRYAEFVRITTPDGVDTFCNAAGPVIVDGITFIGMGSYLGVTEVQRDIKATSFDLKLTITGLNPANIALVLSASIKGSKLEVWRGFLDSNNQIITVPTQQFFKRYEGIINNIAINEDYNTQARTRIATCVISSASMRMVLDNRIAGIKTNPSSWNFLYPDDTSMNRVPIIAASYFDFGQEPNGGSQAVVAQVVQPSLVKFKTA